MGDNSAYLETTMPNKGPIKFVKLVGVCSDIPPPSGAEVADLPWQHYAMLYRNLQNRVPDSVLAWECNYCHRHYYTELPPVTCEGSGDNACGASDYRPIRLEVEDG